MTTIFMYKNFISIFPLCCVETCEFECFNLLHHYSLCGQALYFINFKDKRILVIGRNASICSVSKICCHLDFGQQLGFLGNIISQQSPSPPPPPPPPLVRAQSSLQSQRCDLLRDQHIFQLNYSLWVFFPRKVKLLIDYNITVKILSTFKETNT